MTDKQAKVLALIRQKGEMRTAELTTYQGRSVYPLVQAGYLRYIQCGDCIGCKHGRDPWSCYNLKVKANA